MPPSLLNNQTVFATFQKKCYFCRIKSCRIMNNFFETHKRGFTLFLNLLFWLITTVVFIRFSAIRPVCNTHIYKEFVCVLMILCVVLITRWITIPNLFSCGRFGAFWSVSVCMLFAATFIEVLLIQPEITDKIHLHYNRTNYLSAIYISIFLRDSCFFAWFLVFRLYALQKDAFRTKQRTSVMEHQSVQFSLPDQNEVSIPLDLIVYIQETDHVTQVYCTEGNTITIVEPLSYCKEMIPSTLWSAEGSDKMVFHQRLSEFIQLNQKTEIREIRTVALLNKRQFKIFEIIRQNPNCNTTFIGECLGGKITNRTIERDISSLRSKGVINYQGQKKGGGYTICHSSVVEID